MARPVRRVRNTRNAGPLTSPLDRRKIDLLLDEVRALRGEMAALRARMEQLDRENDLSIERAAQMQAAIDDSRRRGTARRGRMAKAR